MVSCFGLKTGKKNIQKLAFSLAELSVVIVITSVMLSTVMVSRNLIVAAKANKAHIDALDLQKLFAIFRNTFDCPAGDCIFKQLPASVTDSTPAACFNLEADYVTPLASQMIPTLGNGEIDSNSKRTCAFYELQALEPQAFGATNPPKFVAFFRNPLTMQSARAIGRGKIYVVGNPKVATDANTTQVNTLNAQIAADTKTISDNKATILSNQNKISPCEAYKTATAKTVYAPPPANLDSSHIQWFKDSWISNFSNGTTNPNNSSQPMLFTIYADQDTTYTMKGQYDGASGSVSVNGGTAFALSRYDSGRVASQTINLVKGINVISVAHVTTNGSSGVALSMDDASGKEVWNARSAAKYTQNAGAALSTGTCPDAGCSGTNCYCSSTCKTNLGTGAVAATYNKFLSDNDTLTATNTNLTKAIADNTVSAARLSNPSGYIELSIPTATSPVVSGQEDTAMWELRTNNYTGAPTTGFYPMELTNNPSEFSSWNRSLMIMGRSVVPDSITTTNADLGAVGARMAAIIDRKYDDGLPYSGNIVAGKNVSQYADTTACTSANITDVKNLGDLKKIAYASSNSASKGCVLSWKVVL